MNKTIKLAVFLGVVAAISGLLLGFVNSITEPIIEAKAIEEEKANLEIMYPNGKFEIVSYKDEDNVIISAYKANGSDYVFKATAVGYNSSTPIIALVGVDSKGAITNVVALQQQETNGIGSKVFDQENINNLYVGKNNIDDIDTFSGATFTSSAMKTIMTNVFEALGEIK